MKENSKGFTLPEILTAIAIMAILTISGSSAYRTHLTRARDGERKADLEKIKVALYDYGFDQGCFPKEIPSCSENLAVGENKYLENFPCDPSGQPYTYTTEDEDCPQWFKVLTNLENTDDTIIEKIRCNWGCGPECAYNYGISSSNKNIYAGCISYYACTPSGECADYENPKISQCPIVFENDPTCQDVCSKKENKCHDNRGKRTPEEEE